MDLFIIFFFFIIFLLFIFIIKIFLKKTFQPYIHGFLGELAVKHKLKRFNKSEYILLNNVILYNNDKFTQIDHILISIYGIFVIETKNYSGWIFGSEFSDQWTKNKFGKKFEFYNPIKQNYGHIKAVANILGLNYNNLISIVVFSNKAKLKNNYTSNVINISKLNKTIKNYYTTRYTREQIESFKNKIIINQHNNRKIKKIHIKEIKKSVTLNKIKIKQGICPRCNGELILRKGKKGKFYGCSNFPKCRFTKSL